MNDYVRTGVTVTDEEREELLELAKAAQSTPVMAVSTEHAMRGGFAGGAWGRFYRRLTNVARDHGLGEIDGEWGLDGETGELLAPGGWEAPDG